MNSIGPNLVKLFVASSPTLGGRTTATTVLSSAQRSYVAPVPTTETSSNTKEKCTENLAYVSYESPTSSTQTAQTPLIIHHALFGRKENFLSLGKKFHHLTKRSVLIPDARNHGNSPPCLTPSVKQMSSDLTRLSSQLKVEKACLLGHATGGRVAMMTALTKPELVDRLVVVSSSPMNTTSALARWERNRQACYIVHTLLVSHGKTPINGGIVNSMEFDNEVEFMLEVDSALKSTMEDRSERALFLTNLGRINTTALLNNPDLGRFPDLHGNTFNGPTLFITGERQPTWENDEEVRAIKQFFPNAFFVKIPGAGHWVHTEKKDDFLAAAVTFLQTEF